MSVQQPLGHVAKIASKGMYAVRDSRASIVIGASLILLFTAAASAMPLRGAAPASAAAPKTVAILPGHGGAESGAVHRNAASEIDLLEKDVNLAIARKLAAKLQAGGYHTVLTRDGDYSLTPDPSDAETEIQAHLDVANGANADILVAIHNNGFPDPTYSGTETYYCPERSFAAQSARLAQAVQKHIVSGLRDVMGYQTSDNGVKLANYKPYGCLYTLGGDRGGTFRPSAMPGILVEGLFVTNDAEAWILSQDGGQDLLAAAMLDGIKEYFQ